MDINFELGELKFVWDSDKAEKNYRKHKIKFEDAIFVFLDENKVDEFDEIHSEAEDRYKIIGKVGKILVVIYTEREELELFQLDKLQKPKGVTIMSNFVINGVEVNEEQYNRIKNMRQLSDDEIDLSDIPEITKEEWQRVKLRRLNKKNLKVAG